MTNKQRQAKIKMILKAHAIVNNNDTEKLINELEKVNKVNEKKGKFEKRLSDLICCALVEYLGRNKAKYQEALKSSVKDKFFRDYHSIKFSFKKYLKVMRVFETHSQLKEIQELKEILS